MTLAARDWIPVESARIVDDVAACTASRSPRDNAAEIAALIAQNREIHERTALNLNPGTNVMSPRVEAALAAGLGSRPSLGYPGAKYEMGLEAIERLEVIAAELASEVFGAAFAEVRVASGAMANLYAFMATCSPGDAIVVPPPAVAGHATHQDVGAAGLYGLRVHPFPVDAEGYGPDLAGLADLAERVRPALITIGGSLNLWPYPVAEVVAIARRVGARVLYDAAHVSGMIAGRAWQQPLAEGADVMTMSTYKSLGGPPAGLLLTDDAELAERVDAIAYPGLTANFDAGKTAALALALLDAKVHGRGYARQMAATAVALAQALADRDVEVFGADRGYTSSHQFALPAARYGGGQAAAARLRRANLLTCGIGLPLDPVDGDLNGLRIGTNEIVRWGLTPDEMPELAEYLARALIGAPESVAADVTAFRRRFTDLHYVDRD